MRASVECWESAHCPSCCVSRPLYSGYFNPTQPSSHRAGSGAVFRDISAAGIALESEVDTEGVRQRQRKFIRNILVELMRRLQERFLERSSLSVCVQCILSPALWKTTSESCCTRAESKLYSSDETYLEEGSFVIQNNQKQTKAMFVNGTRSTPVSLLVRQ